MIRAACALACVLALGCKREQRRWHEPAAAAERPQGEPRSSLHAGPLPAKADEPAAPRTPYVYDHNAWAISEGKTLYNAMNCNGCHSHGGGGMGPPLRDGVWIYGVSPEAIFTTIVEGRPRGMPAYRGKLAEHDVWKLVAYVRALGGQIEKDALSARDEHMRVTPPQTLEDEDPPGDEEPNPP